jgi:predicted acetyltransferase
MTTAGNPETEGIEVRPVDGVEISSFLNVFETAWASRSDGEQRRLTASAIAGERTLGAYVRGEMAGTAMSFSMELTLPGRVQVPMAGVSYVAVHPLHRRRGTMRALMRHQIDDLRARDVPLAGLGASEAGIYSRFGYGPATWDSSWRLARGAVRDLAERGDPGALELVDAQVARELFPAVHEEARRSQVGEVRTYPGRWDVLIGSGRQDGKYFVLCRDHGGHPSGYAIYRLQREARYSSHATVVVDHLVTSTDAAYYSLWAYLADLDLTDWVAASGRPEHEPLYWALADRRQLTITAVYDHLWIRLVDLADALRRRRYAAEGSLVLDVTDRFCPWNEGHWLLEGGPGGAECRRARGQGRASLRLDASALASLFLGGVSVAHLARAGRVTADVAALRRAHLMFGTDQDPWCSTEF